MQFEQVHAEKCDPADDNKAVVGDPNEYSTYLATRPPELELKAIQLVADLAKKYKG